MKFTREELLQQKALLEKHLSWLESKLEGFETGEQVSAEIEKPEALAAPESEAKAVSEEIPSATSVSSSVAPQASSPEQADETFSDIPGGPPIREVNRGGCMIAGACLVGFILFCLFGLPYLIY